MTASQLGPASAKTQQETHRTSNCQPMPQQDLIGGRGHDMRPQKFVRLIGCHDSRLSQPPPQDVEQTH